MVKCCANYSVIDVEMQKYIVVGDEPVKIITGLHH